MTKKTTVSKIDIDEDIFSLMQKGICPICKIPMIKNGKMTHSKSKLAVCEEQTRELSKKRGKTIDRSVAKVGDKEIEIDARIMSNEDAEKLKKTGSQI